MDDNQRHAFRKALQSWYRQNYRKLPWRETTDPYRIWVSEVMLQQTQVATVIGYFNRFIGRFPDISSLAQTDLQAVLKLWEGLGYYSRARNLHKAVRLLAASYDGRVPDTPEQFKQLPGVGDYINAAVQSIAFNRPLAVVDGNVKRVLARLFQIGTPVNQSGSHKAFQEVAQPLLDPDQPADFNQGMMELGALVCRPAHPQCDVCPVSLFCEAYASGSVDQFPRRVKKPPTPLRHMAMGVVRRNGRILMVQRHPDGFLGGMWEFPGGRVTGSLEPAEACVGGIKDAVNLNVAINRHLGQVRHAYTHFKLRLDLFLCRPGPGKVQLEGYESFRWILPGQLADLPLHKAVHKCLPALFDSLG